MTSPAAPDADKPPMVTCRVCENDVPTGTFCGFCGAAQSRTAGNGPDWLRVRTYGAADGENVLRLSMVSSLFPHLPHRSRSTFRWGLAALVVVLVVLALLRWQAALVAVCALGLPLLFLIYVEESDVYGDDDLPLRTLLLTAALGAALGLGWTLLTAPAASRAYADVLGGWTWDRALLNGLAIPVAGALLMLIPTVIVRLLRPKNLESLDGFLIGSLGAIAFTAAGTLVRLAPRLASGPVDHSLPIRLFLVEAGLQGVAVPLTAASVGGMFGAAVWLTWQGEPRGQGRNRFVSAIIPTVLATVVLYAAVGLIDSAALRQEVQLGLHLLLAVGAVLMLRIAVHLALLKETHDELRGEPALCAECQQLVPDMAFCPNCGVATRASSRSSRTSRRVAAVETHDANSEDA
jgi:hypothetical protein